MLVEMITLAASPEAVLEPGKTYNLPKAQAQDFVKAGAARYNPHPKKVMRVPPQPDPEDVPELPEEDELTEAEDDNE